MRTFHHRTRSSLGLELAAVVLLVPACPALAGGAVESPGRLPALLDATGLKYMMQDDTTGVLLLRGENGTHVVTVRLLDELVAAFAEIVEVQEDNVPAALWKKAAEVNARPSLAHVGYAREKAKFYAISGYPGAQDVTGALLKAMITDVALLADELQPAFRDLLAVE